MRPGNGAVWHQLEDNFIHPGTDLDTLQRRPRINVSGWGETGLARAEHEWALGELLQDKAAVRVCEHSKLSRSICLDKRIRYAMTGVSVEDRAFQLVHRAVVNSCLLCGHGLCVGDQARQP